MDQLKLPESIATRSELVAVLRNVDEVLDLYIENKIRRDEGVDFSQRPEVSSNLAQLISLNDLEVTPQTLSALKKWLEHLKDHAPVIRFTFASDPTKEFLTGIVRWLRENSGRFVLIRYGIQPTIAAGCLMYTPARQYDFSLRRHLLESNDVFAAVLERNLEADEIRKETKASAGPDGGGQ